MGEKAEMKLKQLLPLLVVLLAGAIGTTGCTNTVDTMMDDYNSNFTAVSSGSGSVLCPGDSGFDEEAMLRDEYYLGQDCSLNLLGPPNCDSWSWEVRDPVTDVAIATKQMNLSYAQYKVITPTFTLYGPDCGLENGKSYKLILEVKLGGRKYRDIATLVTYEHWNWH